MFMNLKVDKIFKYKKKTSGEKKNLNIQIKLLTVISHYLHDEFHIISCQITSFLQKQISIEFFTQKKKKKRWKIWIEYSVMPDWVTRLLFTLVNDHSFALKKLALEQLENGGRRATIKFENKTDQLIMITKFLIKDFLNNEFFCVTLIFA